MHNATFLDARACFNLNQGSQRDETKCAEGSNPFLILTGCLGTLLLLWNHLVIETPKGKRMQSLLDLLLPPEKGARALFKGDNIVCPECVRY